MQQDELPWPNHPLTEKDTEETRYTKSRWCCWCGGNLAGPSWESSPQSSCYSCGRTFFFANPKPSFALWRPEVALNLYKNKKKNSAKLYESSIAKAHELINIRDYNERREKAKRDGAAIVTEMFFACREKYGKTVKDNTLYAKFIDIRTRIEMAMYEFIHPELLLFEQRWLAPELLQAWQLSKTGSAEDRKKVKDTLFTREQKVVFTIPFFSEEFCNLMVEEMESIQRSIEYAHLDYKGLFLEHIGMTPFLESLAAVLNDVIKCFFNFSLSVRLDTGSVIGFYAGNKEAKHHGFNRRPEDPSPFAAHDTLRGHPAHVDSSDITVNVCLGTKFTGGALHVIPKETPRPIKKKEFVQQPSYPIPQQQVWSQPPPPQIPRQQLQLRQQQEPPMQVEYAAPQQSQLAPSKRKKRPPPSVSNPVAPQTPPGIEQKPGVAILHPGELQHHSDPITEGRRMNLIVWLTIEYSFPQWSRLDAELQLHILSFLSLKDLHSVARCNSTMRALTNNNSLWHVLYDTTFPPSLPEYVPPSYALGKVPRRSNKKEEEGTPTITATKNSDSWKQKYQNALQETKAKSKRAMEDRMNHPSMYSKAYRPELNAIPYPSTASFEPIFQTVREKEGRENCYVQ